MMRQNKVCVIGLWHLGAVTSACLADLGYNVEGVDFNTKVIANLNAGIPPLFEPDLEEMIRKNMACGRLEYTTDLEGSLRGAAYVLLTYDTPVNEQDDVDLSQIFDVVAQLAAYLENDSTLIISSQVPVGTCDKIASIIRSQRPSLNFDIAYVPENLRLGHAIERFKHPEMIVIGCNDDKTRLRVQRFLSVIEAPKLNVDLRTAEMTKHAINAFLATSISFINEIANLCDEVGADALKVAEAMRWDSRIGKKALLRPGFGFSGGTLARDIKILQNLGEKNQYHTHLINGVLKVNEQQTQIVTRKMLKVYGQMQNLRVGILGLTYKAGTSTLRRSPSIEIIKSLRDSRVATVKAYDPKADLRELPSHDFMQVCLDPYEVAKGSDALIFVTDWPEFKQLDFARIRSEMRKPVVVDAQNMLDAELMVEMGFAYFGVGRGQTLHQVVAK
jgi:UDPglucose 6-dehydrogenase